MKKIILSLVAIVILAGSTFAISHYKNQDIEGSISIVLIDEFGDTISNIEYDFTSEDTLFGLLDENYELGCANSSYSLSSNCESGLFSSRVLMKIDSIETDWMNTYIAIYENDDYSLVGIDFIALNDGDIFVFKYKEVGGDT